MRTSAQIYSTKGRSKTKAVMAITQVEMGPSQKGQTHRSKVLRTSIKKTHLGSVLKIKEDK